MILKVQIEYAGAKYVITFFAEFAEDRLSVIVVGVNKIVESHQPWSRS